MTSSHEGMHNLMGDFEASAATPVELAAVYSEAEIRDMATVLDEEIAALSDVIETAKQNRATKLARLSAVQQAISLAAEKGLE